MPVGAGMEQSPKTNILIIAQDEDDCNPIACAKLKSAELDRQVNGIHPFKGSISPLTMNDIFSLTFTRKPPVIDRHLRKILLRIELYDDGTYEFTEFGT